MGRRGARTQVFDGVPFFEGCDRQLLADLALHADRVRVPAGTTLAVAGRHAWQLLVLLDGTAWTAERGRIGELVAGQAVAPDAVAAIAPFPATVTTLSDAEVLVVNGPAFAWAVRRHPTLARPVATRPVAAAPPTGDPSPAMSTADAGRGGQRRPRRSPAAGTPSMARTVHDRNSNVVAGAGR